MVLPTPGLTPDSRVFEGDRLHLPHPDSVMKITLKALEMERELAIAANEEG